MSKTKLMFANFSLAALLFGAGWVSTTSFPLVAAQEQAAEQKKEAPATDNYDFAKTFPPSAGQRIRVGGNMLADNLISKIPPAYPALARQARIQGRVRLGVLVGTDGQVHDIALISGHPLLTTSAMEAVRQWVYRPVLLNGNPVEAVSVVDVNYTLEK